MKYYVPEDGGFAIKKPHNNLVLLDLWFFYPIPLAAVSVIVYSKVTMSYDVKLIMTTT